jgi:hypothetical protein
MPRSARSLTACLIAIMAVIASCGRKAPPQPPQPRVAQQTRDLAVVQKATNAVLTWSYPSLTAAGGPLPDVEAVEVWRLSMPVGQEPKGTTARDIQMRQQLLETQGEVIATLDPPALAEATRGTMLRFEDDLEAWREPQPEDLSQVLWYGVRTVCCHKRPSRFSNIARLLPTEPPQPPPSLAARPEADGIVVVWGSPGEGLEVEIERSGDGEEWQLLTPTPLSDNQWRDTGARQGATWSYRARTVETREDSTIVGPPSATISVDYPDVYPPAPPQDLVCLPEGRVVRLRWAGAHDGVIFRVYRKRGGGPQVLLGEVTQAQHDDTEPPVGSIRYLVTAVDLAGNESEAATCLSVIGEES